VECGLSKNTIDAYRRDLGRFSAFCDSYKLTHPGRITPGDLQKFSKWISQERLSTSSIGRHISAVRMFFRFHLLTGLIDQDASTILELPKTWQLLPKVLKPVSTPRKKTSWPRTACESLPRDWLTVTANEKQSSIHSARAGRTRPSKICRIICKSGKPFSSLSRVWPDC